MREIAAELQPETVIFLQVDAALQEAADYAAGDLPEEIALKGRGGTDFRPGFAWLAEQGLRPSCCLYFTDMECDSYPENAPDYPILWCDWGPAGGTRRNPPPWASTSPSHLNEPPRRRPLRRRLHTERHKTAAAPPATTPSRPLSG